MCAGKENAKVESHELVLDFFAKSDKPVKAGEVAAATGIDKKEGHVLSSGVNCRCDSPSS